MRIKILTLFAYSKGMPSRIANWQGCSVGNTSTIVAAARQESILDNPNDALQGAEGGCAMCLGKFDRWDLGEVSRKHIATYLGRLGT